MNYNLHLVGNSNIKNFIEAVKLTIVTFEESDFNISISTNSLSNPYEYLSVCLSTYGSLKNDFLTYILDFDDIILSHKTDKVFSPITLNLQKDKEYNYYFGVIGSALKSVVDINPSFIVGYLIKDNKKNELEIFKKFFY
jgi:hypothetical protein